MRVLIAFDKFKDSLTAQAACEITATALETAHPDWVADLCPLSDGGEGFTSILTRASRGRLIRATVTGPRGQPVEATLGMAQLNHLPDAAVAMLRLPASIPAGASIALIEMATASGLALLAEEARDPWQTTSFGTGELIALAAAHGADAVLLGVGGSATNDLGLGALAAMGLQFLDQQQSSISPPAPHTWSRITQITGAIGKKIPPIRIACDVSNPLLGPRGAAAVYGPQKGLAAVDLPRMELESKRLAQLLYTRFQKPADTMSTPGAGAAGGIAFGLMTATHAQLLSGADLVAAWLDVESHLAEADLVITGEGCFDDSSMSGKGPGSLVTRALALGKPVHVFAGQVRLVAASPANLELHAITPRGTPLPEALASASRLLTSAVNATFP